MNAASRSRLSPHMQFLGLLYLSWLCVATSSLEFNGSGLSEEGVAGNALQVGMQGFCRQFPQAQARELCSIQWGRLRGGWISLRTRIDPLSRTQDSWLLVQWFSHKRAIKGWCSCPDTHGNFEEEKWTECLRDMPRGRVGEGTVENNRHTTHKESGTLYSVVTRECSVCASQDNSDFLRNTKHPDEIKFPDSKAPHMPNKCTCAGQISLWPAVYPSSLKPSDPKHWPSSYHSREYSWPGAPHSAGALSPM